MFTPSHNRAYLSSSGAFLNARTPLTCNWIGDFPLLSWLLRFPTTINMYFYRRRVCLAAALAVPDGRTACRRVDAEPGVGPTKHFIGTRKRLPGSQPPGFVGATSVVRHGGVVGDGHHLQPSHGQAFDGRLQHRRSLVHPHSKKAATCTVHAHQGAYLNQVETVVLPPLPHTFSCPRPPRTHQTSRTQPFDDHAYKRHSLGRGFLRKRQLPSAPQRSR